jgi:splicing factor 3A subunit 3
MRKTYNYKLSKNLHQSLGCHEDIDNLESMIVDKLRTNTTRQEEKIHITVVIKNILSKIQDKIDQLTNLYTDSDLCSQIFADTLEGTYSEHDVYTSFYKQLKDLSNFYKKNNKFQHPYPTTFYEARQVYIDEPKLDFTDEEGYGLYLDLHSLHGEFTNSSFGTKCEYLEYIKKEVVDIPDKAGETIKNIDEYSSYLSNLLTYLERFIERSMPFSSVKKIYSSISLNSNQSEINQNLNGQITFQNKIFWCFPDTSPFCFAKEIGIIGVSKIKRLFQTFPEKDRNATKSIRNNWKKYTHKMKESIFSSSARIEMDMSLKKSKLRKLSYTLRNVLKHTIQRAELKTTKTYQEIWADNEEKNETTSFVEDISSPIPTKNPLKLPPGPDGRPIPYWLYKLHGLNRKFECEICGNQIYEGRRAFEKHFQEARHLQGMQAIGIPNTKIFFEITKIRDGFKLWQSLNEYENRQGLNTSHMQEVEDSQGNVYDRETFRLLKKQGLL